MAKADATTWVCSICGKEHHGLAMVFGADSPQAWEEATDAQRAAGELNADFCALPMDGEIQSFIRGHIALPITDSTEGPFSWSVWVSLSAESTKLTETHWSDPDRAKLAPMFGWLSNALPYPETTLGLPTHVHTRPPGQVPLIELDSTVDHPLVREQVHGITMHRLQEINSELIG